MVSSFVTVSSKYQVVIPRKIREALNIQVGQRIGMIVHRDRIELIPIREPQELRGFLKGMDSSVPRGGDRV